MLFCKDLWQEYVEKVEHNFKLKSYPHLDCYFDFPKEKNTLKNLFSGFGEQNITSHPFLPFLKIHLKFPRYKYQEELGKHALETKVRPISYASHFDTYVYGYTAHFLTHEYQKYIKSKNFGESVLAYRSDLNGKCNIQFAKEVFDIVKQRRNCSVIALDIKGYFDSIDHRILKSSWCKVLGVTTLPQDQYKIFRSITNYSYIKLQTIFRHFGIDPDEQKYFGGNLLQLISKDIAGKSFNEKFQYLRSRNIIVKNTSHSFDDLGNGQKRYFGIPQGSSLSAVLSNIYLIDFDKYLADWGESEGFHYRRYCDDILIICDSPKADSIFENVCIEIEKYHLKIQKRKTEIIEFTENNMGEIRGFDRRKLENRQISTIVHEEKYYKKLQYLGFEFDGQRIYIRSSSLSRYFRKMKGRIVKTVMMANSPNSKSEKIFLQQLYHKYSHLGNRNFLTYARNASKKYYQNSKGERKEGMDSPEIKKQLARHFNIMQMEIEKTLKQIKESKDRKRSEKKLKEILKGLF